ncbi:putative Retinol dehydrogenase 12 [Glarea lozoyensis 74030]|uniref:Putative Retinol dehydrogenase 12 n=1 Tax=Glarea lozoyensis (strain ATCC 74030 / MF5533) TaxID=1104152 RepID=H0EJ28_GLAL7|nr:putative Retinol dehydrogenase 12 [Glarea lozoyensis 74030]
MSQYGFHTTGLEIVNDFSGNVKGRPSEGGIGAQTAISLAHGAPSMILLLGRSLTKIQPTIDEIHTINPSITTKFIPIELSSLKKVRTAAQSILSDTSIPKIDVVINNAAIMISPYELSIDGYELQLATNHLSHFLLTNLIMPKILAAGPGATIVNVGSLAHVLGDINWESTDFNKGRTYDAWSAYAQAKTANALFTVALRSKLVKRGVQSWTLNPGGIKTNLQKFMTPELLAEGVERYSGPGSERPPLKSVAEGCATTLRAALDASLVERNGSCYLSDCQVIEVGQNLKGYAMDRQAAERLWRMSEEMVGERFEY